MTYETYRIPPNFTDAGRLFGLFPIRNAIEAVLLAVPAAVLILTLLPLGLTAKIITAMVVAIPLGGFGLIGIDDDSLTAHLRICLAWKLGKKRLTYRGTPGKQREGNL